MRSESQAQASDRRCAPPRGLVWAVGGLPHTADRRMIAVQEPASGKCRLIGSVRLEAMITIARYGRTTRPSPQRVIAMTVLFVVAILTA